MLSVRPIDDNDPYWIRPAPHVVSVRTRLDVTDGFGLVGDAPWATELEDVTVAIFPRPGYLPICHEGTVLSGVRRSLFEDWKRVPVISVTWRGP